MYLHCQKESTLSKSLQGPPRILAPPLEMPDGGRGMRDPPPVGVTKAGRHLGPGRGWGGGRSPFPWL